MRVARYSYIPPGTYRFRVQARYLAGSGSETESGISFKVLPYYWQTGWFKVLSAFAFFCFIAMGIWLAERRRYRSRLKLIQQAQAMDNERARIARDLHDELGSQLTHISMLSDPDRPNVGSESRLENLGKRVQLISAVAVNTIRSLDEIVWAVNPRHDTLRSLVEYLTQFVRELIENTGVDCRFQIAEDLPELPLTPELRHNLFLVVKEAVNNALKHSRAKRIYLAIKNEKGQLEICIQDDGVGFNLATIQVNKKRNGLGNMRQRVEVLGGQLLIISRPGQGTTVRLVLNCLSSSAKQKLI